MIIRYHIMQILTINIFDLLLNSNLFVVAGNFSTMYVFKISFTQSKLIIYLFIIFKLIYIKINLKNSCSIS